MPEVETQTFAVGRCRTCGSVIERAIPESQDRIDAWFARHTGLGHSAQWETEERRLGRALPESEPQA